MMRRDAKTWVHPCGMETWTRLSAQMSEKHISPPIQLELIWASIALEIAKSLFGTKLSDVKTS